MVQRRIITTKYSRLLLALLSFLPCPSKISASVEFDLEVGKRVFERLSDYVETPSSVLRQLSNYRSNLAFPHNLHSPDRNSFLKYNNAVVQTFPEFSRMYYGLEDGTFYGHNVGMMVVVAREPGNGGYQVTNETQNTQKHWMTCVNPMGIPVPCEMQPGESFIQCVDGCSLQKCPDKDSQRNCSNLTAEEKLSCEKKVKMCRNYEVQQVPLEAAEDVKYGYIPLSLCCADAAGIPSQTPGNIARPGTTALGNCYHLDRSTPVERNIVGDYEYCGGNGQVCNDTFAGCFASFSFDPRLRPWYLASKEKQTPNWTPPYFFFETNHLGITFSHPIYDHQDGQQVFAGVLAIDYTFGNISSFLTENYKGTDSIVAIIEKDPPNYLVATSSGSPVTKQVMTNDSTQPCSDPSGRACTSIRLTAVELMDNSEDVVVSKAFEKQVETGFPQAELTIVHVEEKAIYASQTIPFYIDEELLYWRIMIVNPIETKQDDTILPGDNTFVVLVSASSFGCCACLFLLILFLKNRSQREIVYSDWRFTSAFIFNCSLLNAASLTMIGPNTDDLCLVRMWTLHFFLVFALAPLFVKTYRMYKLVGSKKIRRRSISHAKTTVMAMPFILLEIVLLTIFTLVDPSKQKEIVETDGSSVTHRLVCGHDTRAFDTVQMVYQGGLVLIGCVLAFKTRNLKAEFSEAKQLAFAMYSVAWVGSVILVVSVASEFSGGVKNVFVAVGISYTTFISSCAFVIPRLIRMHFRLANRELRRNNESRDDSAQIRFH